MKTRRTTRMPTTRTDPEEGGGGKTALATGALGALTSGNNPTVTTCTPSDTTWYCRMSRFFNSFQMIINFLVIVATIITVIYFGWKWFVSSRKKRI